MSMELTKNLFEIMKNDVYEQVKVKKRKENYNLLVVSIEGPSTLFSLNSVAADIFELCNGKNTIEDIVNFLINSYKGVTKEKIIYDVLYFIRNLEKIKLIKKKTT